MMIVDRYSIGRIAILMLLGMFTAYTLVSIFGLIIGTILSFVVLYAYIKVMNRIVAADDSNDYSNIIYRFPFRPTKIRYRCLVCYNIHNKRECPRCGSKMKEVEF